MLKLKQHVTIQEVLANAVNVATILDDEDLDAIGRMVRVGYDADDNSRSGWKELQEEALKLALQVYEKKNTPWPNAANIKYPLVTLAAIRFQATSYPALVDSINPVKFLVKGEDNDGTKIRRAIRLGYHMSYQLIEQMDWEQDMDKALLIVPICGCAFKKTYFDDVKKVPVSELVLPKDLVVNYYTKDLETSMRYTHQMEVDCNYIYEQQAAGVFLDVNLDERTSAQAKAKQEEVKANLTGDTPPANDPYLDAPKLLLEQYTYVDLDGDGYKEPYIITVEFDSQKVLRIVPRFDADTVLVSDKDPSKILRIDAEEYFTKIPFIPNPDGSFYDIGFGLLLGPLNSAVNTLINQLLDAGTVSNRQSGFIAKGIRIKGGETRFKPGEWKTVETHASDLKAGIVPLPVREPSMVLYNLVQFLIEAGNRVGSTVDMMVGENPGQNQPATTTMAVLEQGLKVFIAIHKRQYKALKSEYKKIYNLNKKYLPVPDYLKFINPTNELAKETSQDYQGPADDVSPNADASVITEAQRISKAQALLQLLPLGLNVEEVTRRVLVSQKQENIEALLAPNPPGAPDPKLLAVQIKAKQVDQERLLRAAELVLDHMDKESNANLRVAQALDMLADARLKTAQTNQTDKLTDLHEVGRHLDIIKAAQENEEKEEEQEVASQLGGSDGGASGGA